MNKFPQEIAVVWEENGNDDPFMVVHDTPEAAAELFRRVKVGVYRLERVVTVTTKAEVK